MIRETTNLGMYKKQIGCKIVYMQALDLIFLHTGAYAVGTEVFVKDYERKKRDGGKLDYRWLGLKSYLARDCTSLKKQKKLEELLIEDT